MGGYIGATAVGLTTTAADVQGDITSTDTTPELILKNTSEEDTEGGREGKITFKGEQSGGEETTLAQIESAHDGTSDDEKGDLVFKTNDGNDGASPTERLRIDSAGDMLLSSPDPSFTITNTTHEDTDGGRESTIVFKGEQSGGELSTLAEIEASHDGTADDEKGDLIFKTNDGSDGASPTEVLRTNSAGNLLITSSDQNGLTLNTTDSNGGFIALKTSGTAKGYIGTSHHLVSGGSPSEDDTTIRAEGVLQFTTGGGTERMRIDDGGHASFTLGANAKGTFSDGVGEVGSGNFCLQVSNDAGSALKPLGFRGEDIRFATGSAERMRLDASGRFCYNTTTAISDTNNTSTGLTVTPTYLWTAVSDSGGSYLQRFNNGNFFSFYHDATIVGSISVSGTTTSFNTSSDYRLKENVTDVNDGITRVKQLSPKRFNWIADADTTVDGFLAHEAATVVPEAVTGSKDAIRVWKDGDELPDGVSVGDNRLDENGNTIPDYQSIDQSKLVPLLTAALQEAITKIETLETKVAALEAE